MRFWTIQPRAVWTQMLRGVAVRVDPDHPRYGGRRPWQYEWLGAALRRRCPGFDGGWPWWLTCDRPVVDRERVKKLPGGREQVHLELELPHDRCVRFPLWMWETIHTGRYLARTREELERWQRELASAVPSPHPPPLPGPWQERLEESWERLFDPDPPRFWYRDDGPPPDDPGLADLMTRASAGLAGLVQELRASDTVRVTPFTTIG